VAGTGVDIVTSFTGAMACMGNVGPGLGPVGPADNYSVCHKFLPIDGF
jgi:trk system potassium uptake protein TrkH